MSLVFRKEGGKNCIYKKYMFETQLFCKTFGGHQHWGWFVNILIEIMVVSVGQVLKIHSPTEKWVKTAPQGSTSVRERLRVGEGRCLNPPSTKAVSLRLGGCGRNNVSSSLPSSREILEVWWSGAGGASRLVHTSASTWGQCKPGAAGKTMFFFFCRHYPANCHYLDSRYPFCLLAGGSV